MVSYYFGQTQQKHLHTRNIQLHKNKYNNKIIFKLNYAMNIKWLTNSQNTIVLSRLMYWKDNNEQPNFDILKNSAWNNNITAKLRE